MTQQDYLPFSETLKWFAEGMKEPMTADRYDFYFDALDDLPLEALIATLKRLAKTAHRFPRPIEIREALTGGTQTEDRAEAAWMRFRWALQRVTVYDAVDFQDPVLHATILSLFGGWPQTAGIESSKLSYTRASFLKTYTALARVGTLGPAILAGMQEGAPIHVPTVAMPTTALALMERPVEARGEGGLRMIGERRG